MVGVWTRVWHGVDAIVAAVAAVGVFRGGSGGERLVAAGRPLCPASLSTA